VAGGNEISRTPPSLGVLCLLSYLSRILATDAERPKVRDFGFPGAIMENVIEDIFGGSNPIKDVFFPGVYYLIKDKEVVYVGKSMNVYGRISVHISERTKDFDRFYVRPCKQNELSDLELKEILRFQPRYNASLPSNDRWFNARQLKDILNLNGVQIKKIIREKGIKGLFVCGNTYFDVLDFTGVNENE